MTFGPHLPSRREALLGAGSLFAWSQMPKLARAEGRDPRMLIVVLRGALDGLGAAKTKLVQDLAKMKQTIAGIKAKLG